MSSKLKAFVWFFIGAGICFLFGTDVALAAASGATADTGIGGVATHVKGNLEGIAKLITAASYVAGMAFAVGAIVKFKAHKDNPTQIPIGMPIALLFVAAALMFAPSVFKVSGETLFKDGTVGGISGVTTFATTTG